MLTITVYFGSGSHFKFNRCYCGKPPISFYLSMVGAGSLHSITSLNDSPLAARSLAYI